MSSRSQISVLFCFFLVLASACPGAEESPNHGQWNLDAGTASANQIGAAGAKVDSSAGTRASAGSGGRSTAGSTTGAPSVAGRRGGAQAGYSGTPSDQDAGPTPPVRTKDCVVGGCSNQLCTDAAIGPVISTCEWREAYACYSGATCKRQSSGECGWTETPELSKCLQAAGRQ